MSATAAVRVAPLRAPLRARPRVPGSKSLTNRALLCAAMADGTSTLTGALFADDTLAMLDAVQALGAGVRADAPQRTVTVEGAGEQLAARGVRIDARKSGTTSRFVAPVLALGSERSVLDGDPQLRERPIAPLADALEGLGARIEWLEHEGRLPLALTGPALGGPVRIAGHLTSQFVSALLLAGPRMPKGLTLELTSAAVSRPYVAMTVSVMAHFGVLSDGLAVPPQHYAAAELAIEPDATAASYFFAAAAIAGGEVEIQGLGSDSLQGDVAFVDVLERMGARVDRAPGRLTVTGTGSLRGIDVHMGDIPDTAQTLAAVATFAEGPTRVRGVAVIRGHETDRIAAIVAELSRAGLQAEAHEDGFTVHPGVVVPTRFRTYGDHRMAMSLALLGLRAEGIEIEDPGCVAKTYPDFFADLAALR